MNKVLSSAEESTDLRDLVVVVATCVVVVVPTVMLGE
jgi:hypothetical protein